MWNPDQIVLLSGVVIGIIVFFGTLLIAGGNLKAALVMFVCLVVGVSMLTVEHPNSFMILFGCLLIIAGIWLMNVIRIKTRPKTTPKK